MNLLRSATSVLRHYWFDFIMATLVGAAVLYFMGGLSLGQFVVLCILEISLSFDNAVVNYKILKHLSPFWRRMFMWIGLPIAVGGMRFLFPVLIVKWTAGLGFGETIDLAFNHSHLYGELLHHAHPQIAMLGGVFLLLIFLGFLFDGTENEIFWLAKIERHTIKLSPYNSVEIGPIEVTNLIGSAITAVVATVVAFLAPHEYASTTTLLFCAAISLVAYHVVNYVSGLLEDAVANEVTKMVAREAKKSSVKNAAVVQIAGLLGFAGVMSLEVQDASFSFDGVSGAFAITSNLKLIMAGLAIGALFVRSITLHLTKTGAITEYQYMEHGAHYAIGALAFFIFVSTFKDVPEYVTGPVGAIMVGISVWLSRRENIKKKQNQTAEVAVAPSAA